MRSPSVEEAATSSPVAERCVILSDMTVVESRIFLILSSATLISFINSSTASPIALNLSLVSAISSFCFSTDDTEFSMLSLARLVSSLSLLIISVILADASFVCSDSCLISSATTAKPFPASPALAASIEALSASKLVWFEILIIDSTKLFTSSTLAVRLWITDTVTLLASATLWACSFNSSTTSAPCFTVSSVWREASIIALIPFSALSVFP